MAVYGVSGSATYSETLTGIEQMLEVLPDNLGNQITARNVRDVVFTLYDDIQNVSSSVGSGSASGVYYINNNITGEDFGGLPGGSTFPTPTDLQTLLDKLLLYQKQKVIPFIGNINDGKLKILLNINNEDIPNL
jgi:hypothetical protein